MKSILQMMSINYTQMLFAKDNVIWSCFDSMRPQNNKKIGETRPESRFLPFFQLDPSPIYFN